MVGAHPRRSTRRLRLTPPDHGQIFQHDGVVDEDHQDGHDQQGDTPTTRDDRPCREQVGQQRAQRIEDQVED